MPIAEAYTGSVSISTTEISLVSGTSTLQNVTDDGIYSVHIDLDGIAIADELEFKVKEKCRSGDTQRVIDTFYASGTGKKYLVYQTDFLIHGWDITAKSIAGAALTIEWSIRKAT